MRPPDSTAFPSTIQSSLGMDLRTYIATAAMQGLTTNTGFMKVDDTERVSGLIARLSVTLADALIAELNKDA